MSDNEKRSDAGDIAVEDFTQILDDVQLSEEHEHLLKTATSDKPVDPDMIPLFASESNFDHLKPPKRSVVKIILITLLIIIIAGGAGFGGWYYWWTQYASFDYELKSIVILDGQEVKPGDFLPSSEVNADIAASYSDSDFTPLPGLMTVPLTLEQGLRSLETNASLYVLTPITGIVHEFGVQAPDLDPKSLITNIHIANSVGYELVFTENPLPLSDYTVGEHTLRLALDGTPFEVLLTVTDTTPPVAVLKEVIVDIGGQVSPGDFIESVSDNSGEVSVDFAGNYEGQESFIALSDELILLKLSDIYGNSIEYTGSMTVNINMSVPEFIDLPMYIECMAGMPLVYPEGIIAIDDFGRLLDFTVDDSGVDTETVGEYTVTFTAEDLTGLKTEMSIPLFIIDINPQDVDGWVDEMLRDILDPDMTQEENVRAVFEFVRSTITPANDASDEWMGSVYKAAHYAIENQSGAFYHFYALSEIMLTRAGIINMRVERTHEANTMPGHIWSIVYFDPDGWYHYDCMIMTDDADINAMQHRFSQKQAEEISKHMERSPSFGKIGYYGYNHLLYPDVANGDD